MKKNGKRIEVRTVDDKVLFNLYVFEQDAAQENNSKTKSGQKQEPKQETQGEKKPAGNTGNSRNPQEQESRMTDAQQRYLFRLLADRGIEGNDALERLKEYFGVKSLKEVSKLEASRAIEQILEEAKVGGSR